MTSTANTLAIQPYLFFDGKCEEAIDFYEKALGAKVLMKLRFKDSPEPIPADGRAPDYENMIMHARIAVGDATILLSDGHGKGKPVFEGFSMSVAVPDVKRGAEMFNALAEGGKIQMPLGKTFFATQFGMVLDRFGVLWMIISE